MFSFLKKRHIAALEHLKERNASNNELRASIVNILRCTFYHPEDWIDYNYPPYVYSDEEIISFIEKASKEWSNFVKQRNNDHQTIRIITNQIEGKDAEIKDRDKEIERLKEVIACVSSRVIEIVEGDKRD